MFESTGTGRGTTVNIALELKIMLVDILDLDNRSCPILQDILDPHGSKHFGTTINPHSSLPAIPTHHLRSDSDSLPATNYELCLNLFNL